MKTQSRVAAGVPTGGQFATTGRDEAAVALLDLDGTFDWNEPDDDYDPYPPGYDDLPRPTVQADDLSDTLAEQEALAYLRSQIDTPRDRTVDPHWPTSAAAPPRAVTGADLPTLTFTHRERLDRAKITDITNANHAKPDGGLWLAPGTPDGASTWQDYLTRNGWNREGIASQTGQPVALKAAARVAIIDNVEDLHRLAATYPSPLPEPDFLRRSPIDYEAMAEHFDAIWLTETGQRDTHRLDDGPDLYSWDIESVLVLNSSAVDWPADPA